MIRIATATLLTATILITGPSCHRCKNNFLRREPTTSVGPTGGGIFLAEPIPTTPSSPPPPSLSFPESSGSFRIDPAHPPGEWERVPSSSASPIAAPPLPSTSNKEQWLPDPVPNGLEVPPVIDLSSEKSVKPSLGEPLPSSDDAPKRTSRTTQRKELRGLPEFQAVPGRQDVATGLRPTLDGYDWLQANHYKTIIHLHEATHDLKPVLALVEDRGMTFMPINVQRKSLDQAYDTFIEAVDSPALRPLYVSAENESLAGTLWYLTFRLADVRNDDTARILATGLGLPDSVSEDDKMWWLAIQNVMASR